MDSVSGVSSIDHLLETTAGEAWDIDREVHVLRAAAIPLARFGSAPAPKTVGLVLPAPFELAPPKELAENGSHAPDLTVGSVARRAARDAAHP